MPRGGRRGRDRLVIGSSRSAIFAVTYRATGVLFRMVWNESGRVPGEDVTNRYAKAASPTPVPASRSPMLR